MSFYRYTIKDHIRLALMSGTTTFIPWMLPVTYTAIGGLLINGTNPEMVAFLSVVGAIRGTTTLRILDTYCSARLKKHIKIPSSRKKQNLSTSKNPVRTRIKKKMERLHTSLHVINKKHILFFVVAITTFTAIPDILIIKYTRGKLPLFWFLIATSLGKLVVYIPVIYGIEFTQLLFG